jgi:hypothetical protein
MGFEHEKIGRGRTASHGFGSRVNVLVIGLTLAQEAGCVFRPTIYQEWTPGESTALIQRLETLVSTPWAPVGIAV